MGMTTAPTRPGVYYMERGTDRVGALVVNPEAEESDLRRIDASTLGDRLSGRGVSATADLEVGDAAGLKTHG